MPQIATAAKRGATAENAHGLDLETFVTSKLSGQQATGVRLKTAPTVIIFIYQLVWNGLSTPSETSGTGTGMY